jgi:hypothetical protein
MGQAAYHQGARILGLTLIGLATLWPMPSQAPLSEATPFFCLPCGDSGLSDILLNLVLFIPFGLALGSGGRTVAVVLLASAVVSASVELLQLTVIAGRDASAADIVTNTAGGGAGGWLGRAGLKALFPGPRIAALVAGSWAALGALGTVVTAWSLAPSFRESTWYGQWAPFGNEPEWFTGPILAVELGSRPLRHWRLQDSKERRAELVRDTVRLAASIVTINPPPERLRIVAVADSAGRLATLSQRGRDLRWRVRTRAADVYLESPVFEARLALPALAGDSLTVEGRYRNGWGSVQGRDREVSPLDGWSLLLGIPLGGPLAVMASILWLAGWFVPIGFYGGQVRSSAWAVAPAWVLLALPVLVAMAAKSPLPAAWEVAAGAMAAIGGRVLCAAIESPRPGQPAPS